MLKLRKKLLGVSLAAIVAISAMSVPAWSETADNAEAGGADTAVAEEVVSETGDFVSEEEAFSNMQLMAESSKLKLYVDKSAYTFAIENKENGYKWWSGFYNTDPGGKVQVSRRNTILSVDVIGTESMSIESARAYDSNVSKSVEKIDKGVKFTFTFKKYDMVIPLLIVLNDDGSFTATVPTQEIEENNPETNAQGDTGYQLITVNVLENMGAADRTSDGFMIVPDGSGAVIEYNNGAPAGDINTYEEKIYGDDIAVGKLFAGAVTEDVTMPVMANVNKSTNHGLVMIATEGDAYGILHAMVTGQNVTDLNTCWIEYTMRTTDKYYMGNKNEPLNVYEANGIKCGNVSTTYYPIYGDDLTYANVAEVYRNYLTTRMGITKKTAANDAPFYLTLYGGTTKTESILGFPVKIQRTATTYAEALSIIQMLEQRGVNNIKIIYEDFNEAGIIGEVSAKLQYSSKLGGKAEFDKLKNYIAQQGYELFPSCDIMEFGKSGNGYSFTLNASKQITKSYATQTPFDLAYGLPHETKDSWTILSPYYFPDIFTKLIDSFKADNVTGISLNQASNTLYSDFSRRNKDGRVYFVREDTVDILQEGYGRLKSNGFTVMTENANQYILPYADYIKDVPLYSSNYDIFDYDIPFAQMILHGFIPYTSKAINKSANAEELRLMALLTGTPIHYEMMYQNPNKFADSEYDYLYYANYSGWLDRSASEYKLFNDVIAQVSNAQIDKYERLSDREYQATYDNGVVIKVNLDTDAITVNNKSYNLKDYGLGVSE